MIAPAASLLDAAQSSALLLMLTGESPYEPSRSHATNAPHCHTVAASCRIIVLAAGMAGPAGTDFHRTGWRFGFSEIAQNVSLLRFHLL